jgi:hypothetical protein
MSKQQGWQKSVRGSPYTYKCTRRNAFRYVFSKLCRESSGWAARQQGGRAAAWPFATGDGGSMAYVSADAGPKGTGVRTLACVPEAPKRGGVAWGLGL